MPHPAHSRRTHPGLLVALACAGLVAACQAQPVAPAAAVALAAEADLQRRIDAEISDAHCASTADCRTLPVGAKACGGPARWLAWSATASQANRLQALAAELAIRQQQRQAAEGMMSTCSVVPDPGARCDAGRCVLNRPAAQR